MDRIRKLAAAGGAICMNSVYLVKLNYTERRLKLMDQLENNSTLSAVELARLTAEMRKLDESEPVQDTDLSA